MDLTWDLESLYPAFASGKYQADWERLQLHINDLKDWAVDMHLHDFALSGARIEDFLKHYNAYKSVYNCLYSYAKLRLSADNSDAEAMNRLDEIEAAGLGAADAFVRFNQWLARLDNLEPVLAESAYLGEHRYYLQELRTESRHLLSEEVETAVAKLQNTGSKAWERLYMKSISTAVIDFERDGEYRRLSLPELRNMGYDFNAAVRKAAYEAEREAYRGLAEQSAACLNGISGEALTVYELRGYASPLDKVLAASRMDQQTLDTMLEAIRDNLPIFHKYYRKKAELLGHPAGLPFYDVFAPLGGSRAKITYEEAQAGIAAGFSTFSAELGDFARQAFEQRWIDAEPRTGKGNFGMCVDIFPLRESRILANFTGSYTDMGVLAHEIGHAYHRSCLAHETMVNTDYPVPIAETASIFCETLINNELLRTAPAGETLSIMERSLSDAGYYIVDFYARYLFEQRVYEKRAAGVVSVDELNELMLSCMAEAYGDSVDPATIHPYQWISKSGYYMAGNEFLNFPYSFGLLFSKGLYAQYQKQGQAFVTRYRAFLAATSRNTIADIARMIDIDVHSRQFWDEALALIEAEIDAFAFKSF